MKEVKSYKTAIFLAKVLSFVGWAMVVIGVLLMISMIGLSYGITAVVSGLGLVVGSQITRATTENANTTAQILEILKKEKKQ